MRLVIVLFFLIAAVVGPLFLFGKEKAVARENLAPEAENSLPAGKAPQKADLKAPEAEVAKRDDVQVERTPEKPLESMEVEGGATKGSNLVDKDLAAWLKRVRPEVFKKLEGADPRSLTELDLRGANVTDDDLYWIGQMSNLKSISLYGNPITDQALSHLSGLVHLESINLRGTQVTGQSLHVLPTQSLQYLHLCRSKIQGDYLQNLPAMPSLKKLGLNFLALEDAAVDGLSVYPGLRHIELDESRITNAGLTRLMELNPSLLRVEIRNGAVTQEGIAELKQLYPNCEFVL